MSSGQVFAAITFGVGVMLLLGWAYLATGNPGSNRLLAKSLWLFVLPSAAMFALPDELLQFPMSMWVIVSFEEGLKACAARTERRPLDRFYLVALFGILELMLAKPLWGLVWAELLGGWGRLDLVSLTASAAVAALMHLVTAAMYAFHFEGRLWAAFLTSWAVHVFYNEMALLFAPAAAFSLVAAAVLGITLFALWPLPRRAL